MCVLCEKTDRKKYHMHNQWGVINKWGSGQVQLKCKLQVMYKFQEQNPYVTQELSVYKNI
jgi:hypothetical protein